MRVGSGVVGCRIRVMIEVRVIRAGPLKHGPHLRLRRVEVKGKGKVRCTVYCRLRVMITARVISSCCFFNGA